MCDMIYFLSPHLFSKISENVWKFSLILASARKLDQLAEFNAIPLVGLKTLTEYEFQL